MRRALSVAPLAASQRGLSGIMNIPMKNRVAGIAVTPNIQRHPTCPFHEFKISLAVAGGGKGPAVNHVIHWAQKNTLTTLGLFVENRVARNGAGENSRQQLWETAATT